MFLTNLIQNTAENQNFIELMNFDKSSYAKINLNFGGSLQRLILNYQTIIKESSSIPYSKSFASSILFPFVNRIKGGQYTFDGKVYNLALNAKEECNAIHGLVYDKVFEVTTIEKNENYCSITLKYNELKGVKGFPYVYSIYVTYTLTLNSLKLKVKVINNDKTIFPFNIGWHPYFISNNLKHSFLKINSTKKLTFNQDMILKENEGILLTDYFQIKNTLFDDCFVLNNNQIYFKTPNYEISLNSSSKENYLQVCTPQNTQQIALEPMTGFANSFNHDFGFQRLKPDETYAINWTIKLE